MDSFTVNALCAAHMFAAMQTKGIDPMKAPKWTDIKAELEATEDYLSDLDGLSESYEEERDLDKLLAQHGMLGETFEDEQLN